jgi:chaperonin cofactor prefoldin
MLLNNLKAREADLSFNLEQTEKERDALLKALESFENQLIQVHNEISIVTSDRDNAMSLYQQLMRTKQMPIPEAAEPVANVSELQNEVDSLKLKNEKHQKNIKSLEEEIEKLQSDLQVMVHRQRDTGSMANEALGQLELQIQE